MKLVLISTILLVLNACSDTNGKQENSLSNPNLLTVYKRAQCGCCGKWIQHVKSNGFHTVTHNQNDLSDIKEKYKIDRNLRSCHTTVTEEGFVFEGHIPAKYIRKFLDEKPKGTRGLAVPAMPTGSPGMEHGNMHQPYKIYLLKVDGTTETYAEVNSAKEQF
ncbi:MAG: DUF411 domain-containing protein [Gammaproteobacteria bacterium]|nr:DUF411 domain-containing protein [Gammaproteobacteria bacterium]